MEHWNYYTAPPMKTGHIIQLFIFRIKKTNISKKKNKTFFNYLPLKKKVGYCSTLSDQMSEEIFSKYPNPSRIHTRSIYE